MFAAEVGSGYLAIDLWLSIYIYIKRKEGAARRVAVEEYACVLYCKMDFEGQFDEFGNPIGINDTDVWNINSESENDEVDSQGYEISGDEANEKYSDSETRRQQEESLIVLGSAANTFGDDVEVLVETENTQLVTEPLVKPEASKSKGQEYALFSQRRRNIPRTSFDRSYLLQLLALPERIRNVAVIGPLHSGKTSLVDLLVIQAHRRLPHMTRKVQQGWKQLKYTDTMKQEIRRGISIKLNGVTIMATDLNEKSVALNILDAPGHVNFADEVAVCLEACDIALICLDVVEGITSVVRGLIRQCEKRRLRMVFVINKLDRLILELRLPPNEVYLKLENIVNQINASVTTTGTSKIYSPELSNVLFASTKLGFTFSIEEFVLKYYCNTGQLRSRAAEITSKLWGDFTFTSATSSDHKFDRIRDRSTQNPAFLDFILLPLYKIITHTLTLTEASLPKFAKMLRDNFQIKFENQILDQLPKMDPLPLLKYICQSVFDTTNKGLIHSFTTIRYDELSRDYGQPAHVTSNGTAPILARILKVLDYGGEEYALVRIYSGTLKVGMTVTVLDADKENDGEESVAIVNDIALMGGRYVYNVSSASVGQLVLIRGVSHLIEKSGTLYWNEEEGKNGEEMAPLVTFGKIDYINTPCFKVIVEPHMPKERPKLMDALLKVNKYYPSMITRVEESGEHVIIGSGELYLDCVLYDLQRTYATGVELNVSIPVSVFTESCEGESFAAIPVTVSSGETKSTISFSIGAAPLDPKFLKDISDGKVIEQEFERELDDAGGSRKLAKLLRTEYGWDSLTARNVWTFYNGTVLVDDTIYDETDKEKLEGFKQQIRQGFYWAIREGPLCEENVYGVQFNLLKFEANIDDQDIVNSMESLRNKIIPAVRKACYIGLLTAAPILMEPIYKVHVIVKGHFAPVVEELFQKRRGGRIYRVAQIPGTPLVEMNGQLPVIESLGFETDLRLGTNGTGMCQLYFWDKIWRRVPGDVLNEDAVIPKLKPAPIESLARDFVMKTRRRKGIINDSIGSNNGPSLKKYLEPDLYLKLKENGLV